MLIKRPNVEYWKQGVDESQHLAKCARVCYASNKTTDNEQLCDNLRKKSHNSMFRHAGVYYIIPKDIQFDVSYGKNIYYNIAYAYGNTYVSTNRQFADEHLAIYKMFEVDWDTARNTEVFYNNKMLYYTFVIDTGIDITREFNRKSPNAIAERSTRYVDFIKRVGINFKLCHWMYNLNLYKYILIHLMCTIDEWFYKISRSKYGLNLKPEDARWCLFLDTMSKAVYTYSIKEWEEILQLRLFDSTGKAHPDAKIIANKIRNILEDEGFTINPYINTNNK